MRLKSLVPTQEELDAAKRLIEEAKDPSKKLASAMQSFKHWVQTTGAVDNPEALESKLEERKAYMYQYLVHAARHKKAKLNQIVAKTHTAHKKTVGTEGWVGWPVVVSKIGEKRLVRWIENDPPLIRSRPCQRSGDNEYEFRDYWWSESMTEHASTEEGKMTVSHDVADAGEASLAMLDSLALPSSSAGSGLPALQMPTLAGLQPPTLNPLPRVPTEPAPLENGIKQEPAEHELRTRPKEILKTLQDQNLEIGKAILSLQTIKYTTELQGDMKGWVMRGRSEGKLNDQVGSCMHGRKSGLQEAFHESR